LIAKRLEAAWVKKILTFNTFAIICSIIGMGGVFLIGRMDPLNTASLDGIAMDTAIRMTASATKPRGDIEKILGGAFGLVSATEKKFSMHDPDSEISAISAASGREPVTVSPETYSVLASAQHVARLTGGAFDPTMGAVTLMWQEYLCAGTIPPDLEIASALAKVGYPRLRLSAPDTVFLDSGIIDLGGIAKGYASSAVRDFLRDKGITSALIDLGGNVVVMGGRAEKGESGRQPWNIGIQHPSKPRGTPICVLKLNEGAVITAGDYERYWEVGGRRYTHIFDPATGRPVQTSLKSVTTVSNDPVQGDALSTAFMVMGESRSLELLQVTPGFDAIFVSEEEGKCRILATSGLRGALEPMPGGDPIYFYELQ
jgi:thiamine biosynthesis lipoprotein